MVSIDKKTLMQAASNALRDGDISGLDYVRLWRHSGNANFRELVSEFVIHEAAMQGMKLPLSADGSGAIDWTALLEFIKGLLPLILELISLFKP